MVCFFVRKDVNIWMDAITLGIMNFYKASVFSQVFWLKPDLCENVNNLLLRLSIDKL